MPRVAASDTHHTQYIAYGSRQVRHDSSLDVVVRCAAMFLFCLMSRAGNLFIRKEHGITLGLSQKDVLLQGDMLLVTFRRTKTIQFGRRVLQIPLLAIPGSSLCPVAIYKRMIQLVPANPSEPLFMFRCQGLADPLSKKAFPGAFGQGRHPFSGEVFVPLFSERGGFMGF